MKNALFFWLIGLGITCFIGLFIALNVGVNYIVTYNAESHPWAIGFIVAIIVVAFICYLKWKARR